MPATDGPTPEDPSDNAGGTTGSLARHASLMFDLFKLPPELREHVYFHILVRDKQPLHLTQRPNFDKKPKNDASAILATSHQVYLEARPVFLSGNTFLMRGTIVDRKWLSGLGPEGWKYLRSVTFVNRSQTYCASNYRTLDILSKCPNLSLTIRIHCDDLALLNGMGLFESLHGFARATASKTFADADRACQVAEYSFYGLSVCDEGVDDEYVATLLERFGSPCPRECRMHRAKRTARQAAAVHIECDYGCAHCYRKTCRYEWQWQWN